MKEEIKSLPNHEMDETLELMRVQYGVLKQSHNDMPKLKKRTLKNMKGCACKSGNGAHCHHATKVICFKSTFLKKRAGDFNVLGLRDNNGKLIFRVVKDTMALGEVLTHEIAHFSIKGVHNKRFYARQNKLWRTYIGAVISGELYDRNAFLSPV